MISKVLGALLITIFSCTIVNAGIFGRRNCCHQPVVVQQNLIIESEKYVVPRREVRFAEIPDLQVVTGRYGERLLIVDGKVKSAIYSPLFLQSDTEIINNRVEQVRTVEVNNFGQRIIVEQREIR